MTSSTTSARLTSLFEEAGRAHHEAFASVDGHDPDWAAWYAGFTVEPLASLIDQDVAVEDLTELLAEFEESRQAEAPEAHWARYYADQTLRRLVGD